MKGILLSGGYGTRLYPITISISKQLIPVYDKPMIYYPLSVLMLAKIKDILVISTEEAMPLYQKLLGTGNRWGIEIQYKIQRRPEGLAQAFLLGEDFLDGEESSLILGDNIFWGTGFSDLLETSSKLKDGAEVYAYPVKDPERFGVIAFDSNHKAYSLEEKPKDPQSNWAVTGLYFYDSKVCEYAKELRPSPRGELEITDLNRMYLEQNKLNVNLLGRGFAWLDTGTQDSLLDAANFVATIERRQGYMIACLEEIAFRNNWIGEEDINRAIKSYAKTEYGNYLKGLMEK